MDLTLSPIPVLVINLDDRKWKYSQLLERLDGKGRGSISVSRLPAFDAVDKGLEEIAGVTSSVVSMFAAQTILMGQRRYHAQMTSSGAIGCYLSHLSAWKKIVSELKRPTIVMEDDADFPNVPQLMKVIREVRESMIGDDAKEAAENKSPEMVTFDFLNRYSIEADENPIHLSHSGATMYRITRPFFCTAMYMITPKAAQALIETALPIEVQVDAYISMRSNPQICRALKIEPIRLYGVLDVNHRRLATQLPGPSSIQKRDDCPVCEKNLVFTSPLENPKRREHRFGSTLTIFNSRAGRRASSSEPLSSSSSTFTAAPIMIIVLLLVLFALVVCLRK